MKRNSFRQKFHRQDHLSGDLSHERDMKRIGGQTPERSFDLVEDRRVSIRDQKLPPRVVSPLVNIQQLRAYNLASFATNDGRTATTTPCAFFTGPGARKGHETHQNPDSFHISP